MLFSGRNKDVEKNGQSTGSEWIYQGNRFTIDQPEGWQDKTIYTLVGPVEGGIQHNIIINVEYDVKIDSLLDYADLQIASLEQQLKGCRILKREAISLNNGIPAYRAIFRWFPTDQLRLYQEQIYVLAGGSAYKLTTTFTKKTRKTLGPKVERSMMSFQPGRCKN